MAMQMRCSCNVTMLTMQGDVNDEKFEIAIEQLFKRVNGSAESELSPPNFRTGVFGRSFTTGVPEPSLCGFFDSDSGHATLYIHRAQATSSCPTLRARFTFLHLFPCFLATPAVVSASKSNQMKSNQERQEL